VTHLWDFLTILPQTLWESLLPPANVIIPGAKPAAPTFREGSIHPQEFRGAANCLPMSFMAIVSSYSSN
jgi:hypothetical protein